MAVLDVATGGAPLYAVAIEDGLEAVADRLEATVEINIMSTAPTSGIEKNQIKDNAIPPR